MGSQQDSHWLRKGCYPFLIATLDVLRWLIFQSLCSRGIGISNHYTLRLSYREAGNNHQAAARDWLPLLCSALANPNLISRNLMVMVYGSDNWKVQFWISWRIASRDFLARLVFSDRLRCSSTSSRINSIAANTASKYWRPHLRLGSESPYLKIEYTLRFSTMKGGRNSASTAILASILHF